MKHRGLVAAFTACAFGVSAGVASAATADEDKDAADSIFAVRDSEPVGMRNQSAEAPSFQSVERASQILAFAVGSAPTVFGGHFKEDSGFGVWVKDTSDPAFMLLKEELEKADLSSLVSFHDANYSLEELQSGVDTFLDESGPLADQGIVSIGISAKNNTLSLVLEGDADAGLTESNVGSLTAASLEKSQIRSLSGVGIQPILVSFDNPGGLSDSRGADSGGKYGGSAYNFGNNNTVICSYGLPVDISGWGRQGLTAGHCEIGSQQVFAPGRAGQSTYSFGSRRTTSWPGNADTYGDFMVLTGAPGYGTAIWTTNTAAMDIKNTYIYPRAEGEQLCASGRWGNKCRYYIQDTYTSVSLDGVGTYPASRLRYRPDNVNDSCSGWQGGDSGGSVFFSHWSGSGVVTHGMISGSSIGCPSGDHKNYWSTELHGICRWADVAGKSVSFPFNSSSPDGTRRACP